MSGVKIDIGCGINKTPGFLGIDRWPMVGVDVVCDIEQGLPLQADCVDYVTASHSLEHFRDVQHVIREIWRVGRDRARLTIAAPYSATRLNQANPYHVSQFNEHTARFWTNDPNWPVGIDNCDYPGISGWGLASSDSRDWNVDIRVVNIEYFYFPSYREKSKKEKAQLRRSHDDVCDQFFVNCLIIKSPITTRELAAIAQDGNWVETWSISNRRTIESEYSVSDPLTDRAVIDELRTEISKVLADAASLLAFKVKAESDIAELVDELRKVHADAKSLIEYRDWAAARIKELEEVLEI